MTIVHPLDHPSQFENPSIGLLNSQALPDGISPVYMQGELYKIKNKKGGEPLIACAISLLNHLENVASKQLSNLKEEKRIGYLHVQEGKIKSLTLPDDQLQMMQKHGVNEIAFKVNNTVLIIKDQMILRKFTSEAEYKSYVNNLNNRV